MKSKDQFLKQVKTTIEKYSMLKLNSRILVGISGGPDSVSLLAALNHLKNEYKIKLLVFHLNHKLRGKEADYDEEFVKRLCQNWQIPCRTKSVEVQKYARKKKLSLEQAAREIRYKMFEQERKRWKCDKIALGHNADDNAETILLNLARGTGLAGLSGIPPTRDRIIRPLIETKREAIKKYLADRHISYRTDLSNLETKIPRNFIRTKIIPSLKRLNPNLTETITKMSAILREEENYLSDLTQQIVKKIVVQRTKNGITIDNTLLLSYNLPLRRRVLKSLLPTLGYDKIEKILAMSEKRTVGTISLAKDLVFNQEYDRIFLGAPTNKSHNRKIPVPIGKSLKIKTMGIEIETGLKRRLDLKLANKDLNTEIFDYDKLLPPFYLRYRQPGDRFVPFGGQEKKLKEVLIDDKIPRRIRSRLPLFCDSKGILWILSGRRSARARIAPQTKNFLFVKIKEWKDPLLRIE